MTDATLIARLRGVAAQVSYTLAQDERIRVIWLTGSIARGTADASSDVDLRIAVTDESYQKIGEWWIEIADCAGKALWKTRASSPPNEVYVLALLPDYQRVDFVVQSAVDQTPRAVDIAEVLVDKDAIAGQFDFSLRLGDTIPASLRFTVEEFIRFLGMLSIIVERADPAIGIEGQTVCYSLLAGLMLMENGFDRSVMSKRRVWAYLNEEQRDVLRTLAPITHNLTELANGRIAMARIFLPRARQLMAKYGLPFPEEYEAATWLHLKEKLGLEIGA